MRPARQTGPQKTAISGPFNHFLHPTQRPAPPQPPKSLAAINRNPQSDRLLERLREELRKRGYLPIVFNFDKPETKDFTETVRLLAGLSKFVIADLSSPKSAPYELGAIVSQTMIPFQPIIAAGETPFAMFQDLWINYEDRVFRPIHYSSLDALISWEIPRLCRGGGQKLYISGGTRARYSLSRRMRTLGGAPVDSAQRRPPRRW